MSADGRIAIEGGLHVERQRFADFGNLFQELDGFHLAQGFEVGILGAHFGRAGVVPQGPADLGRELVVQRIDQFADVIEHVAHVQTLAAAKAGIDDFLEIFAAGDDHVVVRQRAVAQVVDRADLAVGLDDPLGQLGQLLFESQVGGHCRSAGQGSVVGSQVSGSPISGNN